MIPSWNNLDYLKICVESIRKNSVYHHQIIVHVNDGSDGTLGWVKQEGMGYTYTKENVGICVAMNMMRSKVRTDYICYFNDDMYALPGWDAALYDEIVGRGNDKRFFLSGCMIQPLHEPCSGTGVKADYGDCIEKFREKALLNDFKTFEINDWKGATWPPNIVHRDMWDLVGGYSLEFSPGMGSDPDFTAKLYFAGVRHFKGVSACRVYHFETKSTERIRKNDSASQFLFKWGMPMSVFRKRIIRMGEAWDKTIDENQNIGDEILRGRLKAIGYACMMKFGTLCKIWQMNPGRKKDDPLVEPLKNENEE